MDALGDYLGALWKQSMHRMTETAGRHEARDQAAYARRMARRPGLEYSAITNRWESNYRPVAPYLVARDGVILPRPADKAA